MIVVMEPRATEAQISKVNGNTEKRYQATTTSFFWKIDIPPSYELEKTLFLGICSTKKSSNSRKRKKED